MQTNQEEFELGPTRYEQQLHDARQYAAACVPDLTIALAPGEKPIDVADALLEQFPPDESFEEVARDALIERLSLADTSDEPTDRYAAISDDTITHLSPALATDHEAQRWHAGLGSPGALVALDLADDEQPEIGDSVKVDEDGVATLSGVAS